MDDGVVVVLLNFQSAFPTFPPSASLRKSPALDSPSAALTSLDSPLSHSLLRPSAAYCACLLIVVGPSRLTGEDLSIPSYCVAPDLQTPPSSSSPSPLSFDFSLHLFIARNHLAKSEETVNVAGALSIIHRVETVSRVDLIPRLVEAPSSPSAVQSSSCPFRIRHGSSSAAQLWQGRKSLVLSP